MKRKTLPLVAAAIMIAATLTVSCSDEPMVQESTTTSAQLVDNDNIVYPNSPNFKSTLSRADYSFETNWENFDSIRLGDGRMLGSPWNEETSGSFDRSIAADIYKEDGWTMVAHTLNMAPAQLDKTIYMIFYNKRTGELKVFYYQAEQELQHGTGVWHVDFLSPQGWMNASNEIAIPSYHQFMNQYEYQWRSTISMYNGNSAIKQGWNLVSIPTIAYDPNASASQIITLDTSAYTDVLITAFSLSESTTSGTIITDGGSSPLEKVSETLSTHAGEAAKNWIKVKGNSMLKDLLGKGVSALVSGGVGDLVNSFLGSFAKPADPKIQTIKLSTRTESKIEGVASIPCNTGAIGKSMSIGENKTGLKLGVWNLTEDPTVYLHPVGVLYKAYNGIYHDENAYVFGASGKYKTSVLFNPQIEKNIKKYWVECTPIKYVASSNKDIPKSLITYSDFGSIGKINASASDVIDQKDLVLSLNDVDAYKNNAKAFDTYGNIWNKYGKPNTPNPLYKYIYAPSNEDIKRGNPFSHEITGNYLKVSVFLVTEFEGKRDTTVNTRTFSPKYEWDPDMINKYKNCSMEFLQSMAAQDEALRAIDYRVKENMKINY